MPDRPRNNLPTDHDPFPLSGGPAGLGVISDADSINSIDDLPTAHEMADSGLVTGGYLGLTVDEKKLRAFFLVLAAGLVLIALRVTQVQLVLGDYYQRQAEGNRTRTVWTPSPRGILYDRNGTTLVRNVPSFTATLLTGDLPDDKMERSRIITRLAAILDRPAADIENEVAAAADRTDGVLVIGERLTHDQAILIAIESARYGCVNLVVGTRRDYLAVKQVNSLSHIIGFEGRPTAAELESATTHYLPSDYVGKTGLERRYEQTLRGNYGKQVVEVDALGRKKKIITEEGGSPGQNLVLSIDVDLQRQAEVILKEQLRAAGQRRGSVVVLEPRTGEVLALVSVPDFDSNLFAQGISTEDFRRLAEDKDNPMFPRAIAASLPAGSTFKLVVAAAALEEGIISANTSILSTGGIHIDRWFFPDWRAGGHGPTNVTKAIAESVNTFFYAVGGGLDQMTGLGVDRIIRYAEKFGLGRTSGLDLYGEGSGFLPSKDWKEKTKGESWYIGDTYHLAIGQGDILVTPLQIASMTAVFANGGRLIRPRIVNAVISGDGERTINESEVIDDQVVGPDAIGVVRRGMRQAVTVGSARSLAGLPVAVAAKTGTAQWSSSRPTHAWFTSFAPYDDPELVVTVVIEEGGEGSQTAAPVAARLYSWYYGSR